MAGSPSQAPERNTEGKRRFPTFWIYMAIIVAIISLNFLSTPGGYPESNWQTVRNEMLLKGQVERMVVIRNKGIVQVYLTAEGIKAHQDLVGTARPEKPSLVFTIGDIASFERNLAEAQETLPPDQVVYPDYVEQTDYFGTILSWLILPMLLIGLWFFLFRRMNRQMGGGGAGGGIFNIGKSKARLFSKGDYVQVTFADVAGMEEAKTEVKEIIDFLKHPAKYTELGGKIPKGALLVGPPGTGKTLLAKAVAGEANVPFFSLSGSDFMEMFVGVGVARVRDLFHQAKEKAPCIVFIDEIDSIGRSRAKSASFNGGAAEERENTLNQLLTEMDGFGSNAGVIILAATNRADILDRALLRPGRFDRQIHVELPDLVEREAIFRVHLKPLKLAPGFDPSFIAKQTPGFSGADIANVCNEAALIAARRDGDAVHRQDFLDAIDRIVGGLERKSKILTPGEKRKVAFHEAGHATVSWFLEYASPLLKVSIIPRGRSLGAAWYLPEERQLNTAAQMFHEMAALLGGRAAEHVIFGEVSTGALNDLERVNRMAYAMVAYYGMAESLPNSCFYDSTGQSEYALTKPYSEATALQIDQEVRDLVDRAFKEACRILEEHREGLEEVAELLLHEEVIFAEDMERIHGKRISHTREEELAASLNKENGEPKEESAALPDESSASSPESKQEEETTPAPPPGEPNEM